VRAVGAKAASRAPAPAEGPPVTDLEGTTLGRYRVLARLGRGGMADVYKAFQPSLDRYVAIKVLHPSMVDDKEFIGRFQREAKSVAALRHPNIIQVFDYDSQGDTYYMVMEYIDGPTLRAALEDLHDRREHVPLDVALRIVSDVGAALSYAHEAGVVHRDVKPANILLERSGRVILTDFGVAKILTGTKVTVTGTVLGTPAYMSPEQGMGEHGDSRSDIYSLGVVLYELSTGRLPFDADTPLAVLLKHVHDPLPLPRQVNPSLPEEVERIILKALAKEPSDRYQAVQDMLAEIATLPTSVVPKALPDGLTTRVLAERLPQAPTAPSPTPPAAAGAAPARRRSFALLGGGAVIAIVVCLGLLIAGGFVLYITGDDILQRVRSVAPAATTATTRGPTPTVQPGAVLFEDDFSDVNSGWDRFDDGVSGTDYFEGSYRIWADKPSVDYWSNPGRVLQDVRISVSAFKAGGPDDNDFGVICRYQDTENFYAFLISSDGFYGIEIFEGGERKMIGQNQMLSTPHIHQGQASNEIIAQCVGDHLSLSVNGEILADVRDATFKAGDVGLIAGTYDEPGVDIRFDDFAVHQP